MLGTRAAAEELRPFDGVEENRVSGSEDAGDHRVARHETGDRIRIRAPLADVRERRWLEGGDEEEVVDGVAGDDHLFRSAGGVAAAHDHDENQQVGNDRRRHQTGE